MEFVYDTGMRIPNFWSKATAEGKTEHGQTLRFSCWRSSLVSEAEAHESALTAAKRVLDALCLGRKLDRYPYGCLPLREEVVNKMEDQQGNLVAAVTRNASGVLVLNTERVMFVDIDFPPVSTGESLAYFFKKLFGRAKLPPEAQRENQAQECLDQFMARNPGWGLRLYRTFAGFRGIAVHDVFDPKSDHALDVLRQMRSDPLYVRLCKGQECFRARLTPKPWRCGHQNNTIQYPLEDAKAAERFGQWKAAYDVCQSGYATCRFVGQLGSAAVHPEVAQIVELHDMVTKCNDSLPLA